MLIKSAEFIVSNTNPALCPQDELPQFAFIGRSNVGKSSLINMLTGVKNLAKTSSTPGKTQLINHFLINQDWYLVDLQGYGYAKVTRTQREKWLGFIRGFLTRCNHLFCVLVLLDIRVEPQRNDLEFMEWLGMNGIPFVMVFTKTDKLNRPQIDKNLAHYKKEMLKSWEEMPQLFVTSAEKKIGRDELLDFIEGLVVNTK